MREDCPLSGPPTPPKTVESRPSGGGLSRLRLVRIVEDDSGAISIEPVVENLRADDNELNAHIVDDYDKPADNADNPEEAQT